MQIFIAGVYHEDTNIVLGAYQSKDTAYCVGKTVVAHNDELCNYVKPITVDDFDLAKVIAMVDDVLLEKQENAA